jgi:hypothetical protein
LIAVFRHKHHIICMLIEKAPDGLQGHVHEILEETLQGLSEMCEVEFQESMRSPTLSRTVSIDSAPNSGRMESRSPTYCSHSCATRTANLESESPAVITNVVMAWKVLSIIIGDMDPTLTGRSLLDSLPDSFDLIVTCLSDDKAARRDNRRPRAIYHKGRQGEAFRGVFERLLRAPVTLHMHTTCSRSVGNFPTRRRAPER